MRGNIIVKNDDNMSVKIPLKYVSSAIDICKIFVPINRISKFILETNDENLELNKVQLQKFIHEGAGPIESITFVFKDRDRYELFEPAIQFVKEQIDQNKDSVYKEILA